jgi:hypothetical protein
MNVYKKCCRCSQMDPILWFMETQYTVIIGRAAKAHPDAWRKEIDRRLGKLRVKLEHLFADFAGQIGIFHRSSTLQLYKEGPRVVQLGMIGFFLLNIKTCLNGNTVSTRFKLCPPSIEQYLPLDADLSRQDEQPLEDEDVWDSAAELPEEE